jgi:hypothetical protein
MEAADEGCSFEADGVFSDVPVAWVVVGAEKTVLEEDTGLFGVAGWSEVDGVYSCRWGLWSATAMDFPAELVSPFPQGDRRSGGLICLCGKGGLYPFNKAKKVDVV